MEIVIDNITWNFRDYTRWDEFSDSLGMGYVGIPFNMLKRFIKECAWSDDLKVPPHYFEEDKDYLFSDGDVCGTHDCYNTDTQIVLMNWLHNKRRKYKLDYRGNDPFWIFHDHCHSKHDVYGWEVSGIYSFIEHSRIMQGAEMAKDFGIYMKPETAAEIVKAWVPRFRWQESAGNMTVFTERDAMSLMETDEDQELLEHLIMLE